MSTALQIIILISLVELTAFTTYCLYSILLLFIIYYANQDLTFEIFNEASTINIVGEWFIATSASSL